ncbi:MAG TPA: PQQ-dependent sugar dehydrogenase [Jiangellaceae bacterium]|nr:PQQ-dependent sugar dehydrogenase [Jiangellaceae bacterium]
MDDHPGLAGGDTDEVESPATPDPTADGDGSAPGPDGSVIRVRAEPVVEGLDLPNDLADLGDGRLLVSDQTGLIYLVADGELRDEPVLDLTGRTLEPNSGGGRQELGLAGFTPHPRFADNGRLYVLFTTEPPDDAPFRRVDVLSEFEAGSPSLAPGESWTETVLLTLEQPRLGHVGGQLAFGADGMLYVGLGDAERAEFAQDADTLQGSVIRIDVDEGDPYGIPADNPFVDGGGAPEVYSYGFRNPFRLTWDDELGLVVADPMWTAKDQEVNVAVSGANYGYPVVPAALPASSCYGSADSTEPLPECATGPDGERFEPPTVEFEGQIVSGAVRYTGAAIPELAGRVLVADWRGSLIATTPEPDQTRWLTEPVDVEVPTDLQWSGRFLWSLSQDGAGEVYLMVRSRSFAAGGGAVYRLVPAS